MKVGVFLDSYLPQDGGGYTLQAELFRALCRVHKKAGHEFTIISPPDDKIAEECKTAGLDWLPDFRPSLLEQIGAFFARTWPNFRNRFRWRSSLERRTRLAGIDFVWFLGPRPRVIDLPYLTIVLDLQHRKQPWFPEVSEFGQWETRERLLATFLGRAAGIITGTEVGKKEIEFFYQIPENRIHLLPHPTPDYIRSFPTEAKPPDHAFEAGFLFYPAQFWAHKNHLNLLMAIKQLAGEGLEIPLVMTGSDFGNQSFVKRRISDLGLDEQVTMMGFVERTELVWLYKNALALAYVSFFGPENLPPLEAFALGCPVIAAKVDGAEEQMGDAALFVDPDNPRDIAAAIRQLHDDGQLRHDLITRGRQRAERWSSEDFVLGVFKIIDEFESVRRNWE
jgi:glycosyltransferase involved in cell wall biosynthesis